VCNLILTNTYFVSFVHFVVKSHLPFFCVFCGKTRLPSIGPARFARADGYRLYYLTRLRAIFPRADNPSRSKGH